MTAAPKKTAPKTIRKAASQALAAAPEAPQAQEAIARINKVDHKQLGDLFSRFEKTRSAKAQLLADS